jgi:hypothetical protein
MKRLAAVLAMWLTVLGHWAPVQAHTPSVDRAERVDRLLKELLSYDGTGSRPAAGFRRTT